MSEQLLKACDYSEYHLPSDASTPQPRFNQGSKFASILKFTSFLPLPSLIMFIYTKFEVQLQYKTSTNRGQRKSTYVKGLSDQGGCLNQSTRGHEVTKHSKMQRRQRDSEDVNISQLKSTQVNSTQLKSTQVNTSQHKSTQHNQRGPMYLDTAL